MPKKPPKEPYAGKQVDFRFRVEDDVGSHAAENDGYLDRAFYDQGYLRVLRDASDRRAVVIGRTGVGKSALLLRLRQSGQKVRVVDPLAISLEVLANRSVLPRLAEIGVNLDPFFRFFWRYVFVVEVLRTWQESKKNFSWKFLMNDLAEKLKIPGKAKRRAAILEDIGVWTGPEFWERSDTVAQKIIERVDAGVQAGLQLHGVVGVNGKMAKESTISTDLAPKAQAVLNELCIQRVRESYELLKEDLLTHPQKPLFILIDDLDTAWIDAPFYYKLIEGLIDVVGEFAELDNIKIVVALREDIIAVLHEESQRHRQREKQEALFLRVQWSDAQLVAMMNERIRTLLKDRFGGALSLATLLPPPKQHMVEDTVQYVLDRGLQRPRDLIDFINRCLRLTALEGRNKISWEILKQAELEYSHARLKALEDEWRVNYPGLRPVFQAFAGLRNGFTIESLHTSRLTPLIDDGERSAKDPRREPHYLPHTCFHLLNEGAEYTGVWKMLTAVLYRVGFLGVKFSPREAVQYSFLLPLGIERAIEVDMQLHVHPAFSRVLTITLPGKHFDEHALGS